MGIFSFLKKDKINILGIEFPTFKDGKRVWLGSRRNFNYRRKDYYYKYELEKIGNYIALINQYGFSRINEKKYIKENGYIIIEKYNEYLHIAFLVNK